MQKNLAFGALVLGLVLALGPPTPARASFDGYVCSVTRHPADSSNPYGYITFDAYTAPNCTGARYTETVCSQSGTTGQYNCYQEAPLRDVYDSLMRAMTEHLRVHVQTSSALGLFELLTIYGS
jgi:hypothetical protein